MGIIKHFQDEGGGYESYDNRDEPVIKHFKDHGDGIGDSCSCDNTINKNIMAKLELVTTRNALDRAVDRLHNFEGGKRSKELLKKELIGGDDE